MSGLGFSLRARLAPVVLAQSADVIPIVIKAMKIAAHKYNTQNLTQYRIAISSNAAATVQIIAIVPIVAISQ